MYIGASWRPTPVEWPDTMPDRERGVQDIRWPTEIVIQDSLQVTCERDFPRMKTATAEAERVKMLI